MLGPRGENPRASTAEVRGARTIMSASTQESAFARVRRAAPSALSNELFTIETEGDDLTNGRSVSDTLRAHEG